jgi:hypothetical protein
LTALKLRYELPEIEIVILNSKKHSNIGVGESTQPNLNQLLDSTGIDIHDFMQKTNATFKHGIYYRDWNEKNTEYWHPFTDLTLSGTFTTAHFYQQMINADPSKYTHKNYYKDVHHSYSFCVTNNLASMYLPYALHVDADLMAKYLQQYLQDGVKVVNFDQYDVHVTDNKINYIMCDGKKIEADLYVDCSGFNRVLISRVSECKDDGYIGNVNTGIFNRISYNKEKEIVPLPYTRAHAHSNGWTWTIPLKNRIGTGYVYDSNFMSDDDAKKEFVKYWGNTFKEEDIINKITFSSKSLLKPWESNVVAIGLSSGFIEPLEATGIAWFIYSSQSLAKMLKHRYYDDSTRNYFNYEIRHFIEDVQDFIDVHYRLSKRRDSEYWKHQTSRPLSDRLMSRLENYKNCMPNKSNRNTQTLWAFNDVSWIDILNGYEFKYQKLPYILSMSHLNDFLVK